MDLALTVPGLEGHTINKECLSGEVQQSSEKSPNDATNLLLVFPWASAIGSAGGNSAPSCCLSLLADPKTSHKKKRFGVVAETLSKLQLRHEKKRIDVGSQTCTNCN